MAALATSASLSSATAAITSGVCKPSRGASLKSSAHQRLSSASTLSVSSFAVAASKQKASQNGARVTVCKVSVGDAAPAVSLKDQNNRSFSLSKLRGKNVVFYFYPQAETPGCTKQACAFRDSFADFKSLGAVVVGVSGDAPEALKAFQEKYNLPYTLLSDEGNAVRKEWGVPSDLFGILPGRQTYVIDKKGIVQLIFNNQFQPEKHIEKTLEVLQG